jgi:hypothetical protein
MVPRQRLRETLSACAAALTATLLVGLAGACARLPQPTQPPVATAIRETIEARARAVFDAAVLVKPRETDFADALAAGLTPLLFCEDIAPAPPGRRLAPEIVFYRAAALVVNGRAFPQMSYLWRGGEPDATLRGVRITLDSRGLPVIWEVLGGQERTGPGAVRVVFVAESLEARARAAFGGPLPGRRFAIESATGTSPETLVARALEDGPALMGPEVYVSRAGEITAITCRCMPPQVRRLTSTAWYQLRLLPDEDAEAAALLAAGPDVSLALRLPPDF